VASGALACTVAALLAACAAEARPRDRDGDGLTDRAERKRFKTSPRRADTDRDRLRDGAEVRRWRTNPRRRDTDRDGLSDWFEVRRSKTNPRRKNTPSSRLNRPCSTVVSSLGAAQSAIAAAAPGKVVCLADGSYGELSLSTRKAGEVVLQAQHPGGATIAGARLNGAWLTLASFLVTSDVEIMPGSDHITVEYNRISGGYYGVNAGPTDDTSISDTIIRGNKLVGNFGEDALRINRYHDGPDPDPYGILIVGNEITGVRENGNHSDCLQSVWGGDNLYFVRNYVHDNRCQGFFVKDQPGPVANVVVQDNLFLRNAQPCDPPGSGCGQPAIWQVFGPTSGILVRRNTIWTPEGGSPFVLQSPPWGQITITGNVIYRGWASGSGWSSYDESGNVVCRWEGSLPRLSSTRSCHPSFVNPSADDYRLRGGRAGITWRPSGEPYGP